MRNRIWVTCLGCVISTAITACGQDQLDHAESLIRQLSDDSFSQRQAAMRDLIDLGFSAITPLTVAIVESDPETRWRANSVLEEIGLQGDERTLRKVTRIMNVLGIQGVSGLDAKSRQMREQWLESQVQRITDKLSELGAKVEIVAGYDNGLDDPTIRMGEIISRSMIEPPQNPGAEIDNNQNQTPIQPLALAELQQSIAQIIEATDEADELALANLQTSRLKNTSVANDGEIAEGPDWIDLSQISEAPFRTITIDSNWKGTDDDWNWLARVSRLSRLDVASRELNADHWAAIAGIASLRSLYVDKCVYESADAFAFRESRSDVSVRIVGRGFLGVMGPLDSADTGCVISQVVPNTGAEKAGLLVDDEITTINGSSVSAFQDLIFIVGGFGPGDEIKLGFRRGGQIQETIAVLQDRNAFDR